MTLCYSSSVFFVSLFFCSLKISPLLSITAAAPPNNILFVSNLSFKLKEQSLKKVFKKAVSVTMPQKKEKSKGWVHVHWLTFSFSIEYSQETSVILCRYAFVEFATVEEAEKALQVAQDRKISKRLLRVQFFEKRENPPRVKGTWMSSYYS